jgi:UPF0755 protein
MNIRKITIYLLVVLSFVIGVIAILTYYAAFKHNLKPGKSSYVLLVYPEENEVSLGLKMDSILIDTSSFIHLSKMMNLQRLKPGRYVLKQGMNNFTIINKLKKGVQDPVNVTINNVRDIYQLSGKLDAALMMDSIEFVNLLTDSIGLSKINYTRENILSLFIANTYEMYWTITPDRFLQRMINEHEAFWKKENRRDKANQKSLSFKDIYTIASIVEKETILESEKPAIAGVYINRLKTGMKLQADPTVVFALGFIGLQRVLLEHLKIESPYNTYLYEGLPPGPIYMPSVSTIDSVLNAENHEYIFFCAKPGAEGSHAFAKTLEGHYQNARLYQQWLNRGRIR